MRDRIKELRRVKPSELKANAKNWRRHPPEQQAALRGLLEEIGFADALIARETKAGLELIDGHLRQNVAGDEEVPVLIVDLDDEEADRVLATLDPLAAMAKTDEEQLARLVWDLHSETPGLEALFDGLRKESGQDGPPEKTPEWQGRYEVVVECSDEEDQQKVYERLTEEGRTCRVLTM
jgi:hypothetical protein